jgi:hypothetical protein
MVIGGWVLWAIFTPGMLAYTWWRSSVLVQSIPEARALDINVFTLSIIAWATACGLLLGLLWKRYLDDQLGHRTLAQRRQELMQQLDAGRGTVRLEEAKQALGGVSEEAAREALRVFGCRSVDKDRHRYKHPKIAREYERQ